MNQFSEAFKNLFKETQTVAYPAKELPKAENNRCLIEYNEPDCIYCLKCEKACPPNAILFVKIDKPPANEKNKKSFKYEYNPYLCIYCGECVRACPKEYEALWQSNKKPLVGTASMKINEEWVKIEEQHKNR